MSEIQTNISERETIIRAEDLGFAYRGKRVLDHVSLSVDSGEIVGLLGPNGAGKTTTIRLLAGLLIGKEGHIYLRDTDVSRWPLSRRAGLGLGYLPQEATIFRRLSVRQNFKLVLEEARVPKSDHARITEELLQRFGIGHLADQRGDSLSGGERRRVEIARAIALRPRIILFDEPFAGVDPKTVSMLQTLLCQLAEEGVGILVTDHNIRETLKICKRATVIADGIVLAEGSPEMLVNDGFVKDRFLGSDFHL